MLEQKMGSDQVQTALMKFTKMKDYSMINVATSGGGKIRDYREFYDTTNGHVRGGPLDDIIEESKMILSGELGIDKDGAEFSSLFPFICRLDNDNEVDDPDMWEKACPTINYNAD